jgi:hypothetical protein
LLQTTIKYKCRCLVVATLHILTLLIFSAIVLFLFDAGYDSENYNGYHNNDLTTRTEESHVVYAHFFGAANSIDRYQIVFQPLPIVPAAGENSTLNFSVLDTNNSNINNIYAALTIKEKNTGIIVKQIPYKFYEFSDISFPYKFQNNNDYKISLQTRINGDPKYQDNPLISSFDISVRASQFVTPFAQMMLYYVTPATVAVAVIAIYLQSRRLQQEKNTNAAP